MPKRRASLYASRGSLGAGFQRELTQIAVDARHQVLPLVLEVQARILIIQGSYKRRVAKRHEGPIPEERTRVGILAQARFARLNLDQVGNAQMELDRISDRGGEERGFSPAVTRPLVVALPCLPCSLRPQAVWEARRKEEEGPRLRRG